MPIKVLIPTPLRPYAGKQSSVEVTADTVGEALSNLVAQHPDLRKHLFADDGKLRSFVNVYLNDEDIRYLQRDATPAKETDTITIVPSVAGGCELEPFSRRLTSEAKYRRFGTTRSGDFQWLH